MTLHGSVTLHQFIDCILRFRALGRCVDRTDISMFCMTILRKQQI